MAESERSVAVVEADIAPIVLVTGASGFIASHLIKQLLEERKYKVRGTLRSLQNKERVEEIRQALTPENSTTYPLEFFEADLTKEEGWKEAVNGCTFVHHVASPAFLETPRDENELIFPAVNGTLKVLEACAESGTVKRVVLTSSSTAVNHSDESHASTEEDWQEEEGMSAYMKSKIRAERAAWDFVEKLDKVRKFELAVINPTLVVGPFLMKSNSASFELIEGILTRKYPAIARCKIGFVDVRDVAAAHIVAMETPEAAGHRHIINERAMWFIEMANIVSEEFTPQGYKIPLQIMPTFLAWIMKFFRADVKSMWLIWNRDISYNNDRMQIVLGIKPRDVSKSILESCYSLIELGLVPKTTEYLGPSKSSRLND